MKKLWMLALTMAMLLGGAAFGAGKMNYDEALIPVLNVPRMQTPPTVDGRIDAAEWRSAVKVMGMVSTGGLNYKDRPVSFWVAWDEQHLYIAAKSDILPNHRLYRSRRERFTTGVVYDDSYEFGIYMQDRNAVAGEASSFQKIVLNSLGAGEYMKIYPSIGQNMYNWQPDPEIANLVYHEDGRDWWSMEMVLDLDDLQMPVPNRVGDRVDMLLAADLKNPQWQWLDFPSASGHLQHYGFSRLLLTDGEPYIQVEEISGLHDEKIALKTVVYNPGPKPVTVAAALALTYNPPGKEEPRKLVDVSRSLTVEPGGAARFDVAEAFPGLVYEHTKWGAPVNVSNLSLSVRREGADEAPAIYSYHANFAGTDKSYLVATPRTTPFDCGVEFNPATNQLFLFGDTLDAQIPEGTTPAKLAYQASLDGKAIASGTIELYLDFKYEGSIHLEAPAPGVYQVKLALVDAAGKELVARDDLSFEKKNEAEAFAAWWNNRIGNTETVLKPFEAIKVEGEKAAVTRRVYHLDGLGLPRQIEANGGPVLTGPARIVVTIGGQEHVVPAAGTVTYTSQQPWRTEFTGTSAVAGIAFTVAGWMEQDGLVNLNLTYAPEAGQTVAIEDLRVEWPVDDANGSWLSCIGGVGGNYSPRTIDKVQDGEGRVWDTLTDIGKAGSTMRLGNWESNLWVGNEQRGLCWFGDDDRGWVPNDLTPAHSLYRANGVVVIRNHIVNLPEGAAAFVLDAPRTINLQYNATPFRHLAKGWRLTQVSAANGFSAKDWKYDEDEEKDYFTILSMPSKDPARWAYYLEKYKQIADGKAKAGIYSVRPRLGTHLNNQIALRGYGPKTREPGLYNYFGADWNTPFGGESLNRTYRDYMLYLMDRHVREGGLAHYYFDISFTRSTPALAAGIGYRLPDGRVQPGSMDAPLREWYKRVWALMQEHDLYPGGVSGHATHSIALRSLPWADAILDSEYPIKDAVTIYPKDAMIAMSCPHTFGVNISHLGPMKPSWASLYDAGMGGSGGIFNDAEFRHFGITAGDVEFLPFWRNGKRIVPADDGILASAWKRPGKLIVEVFNYGLDPDDAQRTRSARLKLDLKALGIPANLPPGHLRIRELPIEGQRVGERDAIFGWYDHLLDQPRWPKDQAARIRPPAAPTISASGVVDGVHVFYHDARFLEIAWNDTPADEAALASQVGATNVEAALDWGIERAVAVDSAVTATDGEVKTLTWTQPGTAMLAVTNPGTQAVTATLQVDLDKLGVKVGKLWTGFTQLYERHGNAREYPSLEELTTTMSRDIGRGQAAFDGYTGRLILRLAPGQTRLLFIDTY